MTKRNIEEEIERTLHSLDDIKRAEAPHFLLSKIRTRIAANKKETSLSFMFLLGRPALSLAVLLVTVLLNIYMISEVMHQREAVSQNKDLSIQSFAKVYGMVSYSVYDKSN
jgi:hypothetical protein